MSSEPLSVRRNGGVSFWYASTALPSLRAPLPGDREADVCIVGGGFTGLWTAYYLKRRRPELEIVVLEREFAGFGASGRNGGWISARFSASRAAMARTHGRTAVLDVHRVMRETIDEVITVTRAEGIEADIVKSGILHIARNAAQAARLAADTAEDREWGFAAGDLIELDRDQLDARLRVARAITATWTPHGARVQPAKLVQGLAAAVERSGVTIYEGTAVSEIEPGRARSDHGTVRARYVLSCLEGFTASLRHQRRTWLPLNSAIVATTPLPPEVWEAIGWSGEELLGDTAHAYMYAQRTADGRIAMGGRGVPYRFASRTDDRGRTQPQTVRQLIAALREFFPATAEVPLEHAWCGVLGVPRDWSPTIRLDRTTGLGTAGGYVGDGVSTTNVAGRTLCDLVLGEPSELTRLPWVGRTTRRWEPEPLRWLGARLVYGLYRSADRLEARSGTSRTHPLARVAGAIAGRDL
jgi:glycine/D-amino acid oxidase-like deaminating enzyme